MYFREGEDVAPRSVVDFVDVDPRRNNLEGVHHKGDAVQSIGFAHQGLRHLGPGELVELLLVGAGNDVPYLAAAPMVVVDGANVQVLDVPAEGGELHAEVHPRSRHSADLFIPQIRNRKHRLGRLVDIVQVEQARAVVEGRVRAPAPGGVRETAPVG